MSSSRFHVVPLLTLAGAMAFVLACVSLVDMFLPRPYDGVVLAADSPGELVVAEVLPESGAAAAGIRRGDRIVGIGREVLRSTSHAASILQQHRIGERVPYLVESNSRRRETMVELGHRRIGSFAYLSGAFLGLAFFLVGLFVLLQKPAERAARVFFLLGVLFLLFLVCRLRPASYSGLDIAILRAGTLALLLLPGCFLHFFLIFPRPIWLSGRWPLTLLEERGRLRRGFLTSLYLLPVAVFAAVSALSAARGRPLFLISGAPRVSWWLLGIYMLFGLTALAYSARASQRPNVRRGAGLVFFGSLFGLLPFLVFTVAFPSFRYSEKFIYYGVAPLVLVPLTFAYAIVRFQLLDIRVILRKSLFYTATTALITLIYAAGIAAFNWVFQDSQLAESPYFPVFFALAIVLGLEPLRRRVQGPVDRFFQGDLARLQQAMVEMGDAFSARMDPSGLVHDLVEKLPVQLDLHFGALYLADGDAFRRVAGAPHLPDWLDEEGLHDTLDALPSATLLEQAAERQELPDGVARLIGELHDGGVSVLARLETPRRLLGLVLLSGKSRNLAWENAELELLRGLLAQAAIALENGLLLEERTRRAELERELEIAASIQSSLLPDELHLAEGWDVVAVCRPARHVGGDFLSELPATDDGANALVYGDVAGKSVSAALLMMAAQEVLHSLAMTHRDPERLLGLANRRLYQLRRRSFVAIGYLAVAADGCGLRYVLAGQPNLLRRSPDGMVEELPLSDYRLPLGALATGTYRPREIPLDPGQLVLGYSDGVLEARSKSGEFFGEGRLTATLASAPCDPRGAVDAILEAISRFTDGDEPYDDLTLVAVRRRPEVC